MSDRSTRRRYGLPTCVALVVANMVGVGVFTTSGWSLAALGTPERVLLVWVVGGALAALGAICYGALAARLRESGGEYLFLSRTLHPSLGFLAGWISLWAGFTAPLAAAALGFGEYSSGGLGGDPRWWGTVALVAAVALQCGAHFGARVQTAVVAIKVVGLVALGAFGLAMVTADPPPPPAGVAPFEGGVFATQLFWVSMSYSGWNAAVYVGGEVRDPERVIPRSLLIGAGVTTALYLLLNGFFVLAAPVDQLAGQQDVAAVAARAVGGAGLEAATRALICVALFTSLTSMAMAGPRVYAKMAEDGVFPRWVGAANGAPRAAIVAQGALALAVLWWAGLGQLIGYVGFTLSASTALAAVGLIALRAREGARSVPIVGGVVTPVLFVVATAWFGWHAFVHQAQEPLWALATLGLGLLVYLATRTRRA